MAVSATVTPAKIFSADEVVTISELNKLGAPVVDISGAVGSLSLSDGSVTNAKVAADTGILASKLEDLPTGSIYAGNAGVPSIVALSGDITITSGGVATIANDAVTTVKILDEAVTGPKIAMTSDAAGDILVRGAANYERLGTGTVGQTLLAGGAGVKPEWGRELKVVYEQVEITGVKQIYNHTTGDQDEASGGTKGEEDSFYLYTDGTDSLDATLTRGALSSKVKIEFVLNADSNSFRGWWGKVQSSLDDGASWADTLVGDVGPGGGSDLRRRVQFSALYRHSTHALGQISFSYIHTPGGGTGEEAVRYRVIVGVQASHRIMVNYSADEGNTVPRPTGNGGVHEIRAVSHMTLTEIPI